MLRTSDSCDKGMYCYLVTEVDHKQGMYAMAYAVQYCRKLATYNIRDRILTNVCMCGAHERFELAP